MCMSHIQAYCLFFIVLGPAHEIQLFRFFSFFFGQILVIIFNDFSKSLLVRIYYFWKIGFQFTKLSASLLYSHLLLYLRKGSEFTEKTAKNFSNFNYVYGLGGFDLKFKFKELYVGNSKVHLWFKTFGNFQLVDTQLIK